jgi:hypothetical protein
MTLRSLSTGWRPAALAAAGCLLFAPAPALAGSGYWQGFKKFWTDYLGKTDGVVLTALVVGAISLFIITRGKWLK